MKFRLIENLQIDEEKGVEYRHNNIIESKDKSKLNKEYKKKENYNLNNYTKTIEASSSDGIRSNYIVWKDGNKKVAQIFCDIDKASDGNIWFGSLQVSKSYRGHGLSEQILEWAIENYNVNALTVYKDNEVAIRLYKKFGFKIIDNPPWITDEYYTMIRK